MPAFYTNGRTNTARWPDDSAAECLKALDEMAGKGRKMLKDVRWGCMSGVHTGWAVVKAKDEQEVRDRIGSSYMQARARITEVGEFTPEAIESFHKK